MKKIIFLGWKRIKIAINLSLVSIIRRSALIFQRCKGHFRFLFWSGWVGLLVRTAGAWTRMLSNTLYLKRKIFIATILSELFHIGCARRIFHSIFQRVSYYFRQPREIAFWIRIKIFCAFSAQFLLLFQLQRSMFDSSPVLVSRLGVCSSGQK